MDTRTPLADRTHPAGKNQDDRIWAAVAHGSAFFVFFGPVIPLVIWVTQRKKSGYVTFHALQAMIYQSLFFWAWVLLIPLLALIVFGILILVGLGSKQATGGEPLLGMLPSILIFVVMLGTLLLYIGVGIEGAVASLMGRDFRYPFFGRRLARKLQYEGHAGSSILEDRENQVVGAVCHSTAVLALLGLITPFVVWFTQRERTKVLGFQAFQALAYQAVGLIGYGVFTALDLLFAVAMIPLSALSFGAGSSSGSSALALAVFLVMTLILCLFTLALPAYQILAFVAAVRVLNGHDFHYPILGRILSPREDHGEAQ